MAGRRAPESEPDRTRYGSGGACATSQPLAARAGIELLRRGGNAADAAVAMAAAATVVEPTSNGIGGDAFALIWADEKLHGLNGSGRSPAVLTPESVRSAGHRSVPAHGWLPVTVPGAPALWRDLHARFGRRRFEEVLRPAIELAEQGYPVSPVVARYWARAHRVYSKLEGPEFEGWPATFAPGGRAPRAGEKVLLPDHARTLRSIAGSGGEDFYTGDIARRIDAFSRRTGGLLRAEDLAAHAGSWVEPVAARYRDVELWELPPNGQGIVALIALRILDGFPAGPRWDEPEGVHRSIEAVKLGFAEASAHVGDPDHLRVGPEAMLDEDYIATRREILGPAAEPRTTGLGPGAGTVYLAAADAGGMMVSFIQSNYTGFGSGVVVPGTGIALHNRGLGFSMEPAHANVLAPGKRPFHTIIPGFLTREGRPGGPIGVMGGHMQPQGHVQVVRGLVDFGLSPQAVLDLPRWCWREGVEVELESGWPEETIERLRGRGHSISVAGDEAPFGRGQIILRNENDVYAAGSDPRADGAALVI